jgi:hypothetical protein
MLLFSGGIGNSDILRQPDSIRLLRCLNRPANPKICTHTDVERTLRPAGIFTKFIYCQMRFIFLFLVLAYSCKPKSEFVNPVYPYNCVPDFQPGDSIFFQDSIGNEISFHCGGILQEKKSYDWTGGTKEFIEGYTRFYRFGYDRSSLLNVSFNHSGLFVDFWGSYACVYLFSDFKADSVYSENINGIQFNQLINISGRDSRNVERHIKYDFQKGVVAYTDTNKVLWTLKRMVLLH